MRSLVPLLAFVFVVQACPSPSNKLSWLSLAGLTTPQCTTDTAIGETAIGDTAFPSLLDVTLEDLIVGLESSLFTSVDLVNAYIARINEVNNTLHVITQLNPDAASIAQSLDDERASGIIRGPLHGVPIIIKNNIATADQMDNTAGSYALLGAKVPRDSTIATKLRKAGAVILGKSNLSQWANCRSDNTSNGWSALGGQVYAAYYYDQDPSGSSSGSGVASSLGLALAALGTETDGSIISPSDANNLVGIKPTVGLTSRDLVIPISEHQDTVGPMARTVKDAAYLLSAIAGFSPYDNYTSSIPYTNYAIPDYTVSCEFSALQGKRLGIPRNVFDIPQIVDSPFNAILESFNTFALPILRDAGAVLVDNTNWTGYDMDDLNSSAIVLAADFVTDLPKDYLHHLNSNPQDVHNLGDVRKFTQRYQLEDFPQRDTGQWDDAEDTYHAMNNTSPEFWSNYTFGLQLAGPWGLTGSLTNYSLDAVIMPTYFASHFPAILGTPVVTVPMGSYPPGTDVTQNGFGNLNATGPGIPFGLAFMGPRFSEELLIGLAYAFEQRTHVRQKVLPLPQNIPATELTHVVHKS